MEPVTNWSFQYIGDEYTAPEARTIVLSGEIEGIPFNSFNVVAILEGNGCKKVVTSTDQIYHIFPDKIHPQYEEAFPDAYNRIPLF